MSSSSEETAWRDAVAREFITWYMREHGPDDGGGPPYGQDDMEAAFTAGARVAMIAHARKCNGGHVEFIARCLSYIPPEFRTRRGARITILNYLARMEDVHAAFPRMARNAAEPYAMAHLIPRSRRGEV